LANTRLAKYALSVEKSYVEFPIINKYKGNELMGSFFFEKLENGMVQEVYVEVDPKPIIIIT